MDYSITKKNELQKFTDNYIHQISAYQQVDSSFQFIQELFEILMGKRDFDRSLFQLDLYSREHIYINYLNRVFYTFIYQEDHKHPFINRYIETFDSKPENYIGWNYIFYKANRIEGFIEYIISKGLIERNILENMVRYQSTFIQDYQSFDFTLLGKYFQDKLFSKKTGWFSNSQGHFELLLDVIKQNTNDFRFNENLIVYLHKLYPSKVDEFIINNLIDQDGYYPKINLINYLIKNNFKEYHSSIYSSLNKPNLYINTKYQILSLLYEKDRSLYSEPIIELGKEYVENFYNDKSKYFWEGRIENNTPISNHYFEVLKNVSHSKCIDSISEFVQRSQYLVNHHLDWIETNLPDESFDIILRIFNANRKYLNQELIPRLFQFLYKKEFYKQHLTPVINYCIQFADKKDRKLICKELTNVPEIEIHATQLLHNKKTTERLTGALILSNLIELHQSESAKQLLMKTMDNETNDETRNVILEAIKPFIQQNNTTQEECKELIRKAELRKKLNNWSEKHLSEENLPTVYWKDGTSFSQAERRFLLYRMKQVSGLQSDIEARAILNHVDIQKSEKFAVALLNAFVESNADSKLKYYLVLCGLMGNDNILYKLNALFNKSLADKRVKLAENVLGAIAMIGSNKALRYIEVISRKIANKKPKLSEYAIECLQAAADELNITKDELADRIIPNFDFDGLHRILDINGEEYRAFINEDFEVVFIDDNNKTRKSLPKDADKELVKEFKEIAKEVREISKTQSQRLENLMAEERTWSGTSWKTNFLNHPIMNVFACKLIWILKSDNQVQPFYCDEDGAIYDVEGDEIEMLDESEISILHPIMLDEATLSRWKDKYFEESKKTIFPILERKIFKKLPEELDKSSSLRFANMNIPKGADGVASQLLKRGWVKDTGDGGRLEFLKKHSTQQILANPNIEGPMVFYQGGNQKATVHNIYFSKQGGNRNFEIKDVPDVFYSEVMNDIHSLTVE